MRTTWAGYFFRLQLVVLDAFGFTLITFSLWPDPWSNVLVPLINCKNVHCKQLKNINQNAAPASLDWPAPHDAGPGRKRKSNQFSDGFERGTVWCVSVLRFWSRLSTRNHFSIGTAFSFSSMLDKDERECDPSS